MLWSVAYAQAASEAAPKPGMFETMLPLVIMFGIFYFFIIMPQQKRAKTHQKLLSELKKGDEILTNGGILGTIEGITEKFVTLEVDDGVKIRVLRNQVAGMAKEAQQ